jgi:pSer/pThr/pTyr-binding forkhead associated (FHA) protein
MMKVLKKPHVEVKKATWSKDSHSLFDYESKNINFTKSKVENASSIFFDGNEIQINQIKEAGLQKDIKDPQYLFSILPDNKDPNKFYLKTQEIKQYDSSKQNVFLIVRSLKNESGVQRGYKLELGDIIRLGRIEYKVIEYGDADLNKYSLFDLTKPGEEGALNLEIKKCDKDSNSEKMCKICFGTEAESADILVTPCQCKGSSGYVHITCLQHWINSKVKVMDTIESQCSYWKHLLCEVCKTPLPDLLDVEGQMIQLVPAERPHVPYMLLERIFFDKTKGGDNTRMMILLSVSNETQQIKLGRGHDCNLIENDISVSRLHAFLKYEDSKFSIVDNESKFGTLILLRRMLEIEKKKFAIQIGRTVITLSLKTSLVNSMVVQQNIPTIAEKIIEKKISTEKIKQIEQNNLKESAETKIKKEEENIQEFDLNDNFIIDY